MAPRLSIFFEKYFVFTTLPKSLRGFDETWCKERSHCGDVHIVREALSIYFSRSYNPWT
jgi:hypothetical protein